jgi:hypothetical protein
MRLGRVERLLWAGFAASALLVGFREWPPGHSTSAFDQLLNTSAYCFALWLSLRVLDDHAVGSTMRLAWTMMAWCSGFSIIRHAFEFTSIAAGWQATMLHTLVSLRQFPIVLSLVCLTAGLIAMWASFAALGMGIRFEWADLVWAALIIAFVPFIISARENMQDARSAWPLIRHLQSASPVLLAVPALLAVVLHRIRQEMGGGQMALAFRLLIAFLLLRLVALSASVTAIRTDFPVLSAIGQAGGAAAIWLFPMAALKRWQMTVAASELARRYESNPGAELEQLAARSMEPRP